MLADEDTSVREALLEMLAVERNGVKLNSNLVLMVVSYLVDVVLIKDVSEVDINMVLTVVEDARLSSTQQCAPHSFLTQNARSKIPFVTRVDSSGKQ